MNYQSHVCYQCGRNFTTDNAWIFAIESGVVGEAPTVLAYFCCEKCRETWLAVPANPLIAQLFSVLYRNNGPFTLTHANNLGDLSRMFRRKAEGENRRNKSRKT